MTHEPQWLPGTDPNAETQQVPAGAVPHQPGRDASAEAVEESAQTARYAGAPGPDGEPPSPRPASRRRVLIAVGGITLLSVGGVAYGVDRNGGALPAAADLPVPPVTTASPAATPSGVRSSASPAASARGSSSPSRPAAAPSHSASPSGSPTNPAGSPVGKVPTAPQWYVDDAGPMGIALTMDDGPNPVYTPQVLEVLARYRVKATFNMIGRQIGPNLSLVREVSAAGHTITNHTWDHADLSHYTFAQVCSEMDRCNDALADANQQPTIFRAPYGNWSTNVFRACAARHLRPVGWSVDPRDWDTAHVDTQEIVQNVLHHTRPHSIILEHDGGGDRANTVAALKIFIPELLERGYHFVAM